MLLRSSADAIVAKTPKRASHSNADLVNALPCETEFVGILTEVVGTREGAFNPGVVDPENNARPQIALSIKNARAVATCDRQVALAIEARPGTNQTPAKVGHSWRCSFARRRTWIDMDIEPLPLLFTDSLLKIRDLSLAQFLHDG
jgi:hypothetical protein